MLPFEKNFQAKLIADFATLDPDKKFELEQLLWDTYEAIYKLKLEENLRLALSRVKETKEKLDEDFYSRVKQQTEHDMEVDFAKITASSDIAQVRTKLDLLLKDQSPSPPSQHS
ncbi:hypothetical protein A2165_04525 [Candidatus Curtissbacteria bacterium RBG_13_40_7]|uniref:Uncharacterized protein n=1 Tax=Candidatus Curtissbacteria bacterium RBG_13_40_7 TaxID=1797706 RepID=A0A1F5FUD1_9BACT|nr:MAG: hypothetical protein A2165_04525 [Candidatus Curtissbacteria bacterium RBG_13_40_7]